MDVVRLQESAIRTSILAGFDTETLLKERIEQQALIERAREEAELANQGKTTFLAAAGHDLRQPMHALVQYFGHLKRRNADPSLEETISRIGKSLDSMQDLLDTILEVSKLMMGSVKPLRTTFDVYELLERIEIQMRPTAEDKGLDFEVVPHHCEIDSDEVLLERVLVNLTLNAIRYTDRGRVLVRCRPRGENLKIQVIDTGIGIPKNQRGRVFEAFYQVRNTARDRRKGLGLGLAIVRQLSDLLAMPVQLRSKEGKGSIFSIELPMSHESRSVSKKKASSAGRDFVKGSTVVLIDDDVDSLGATAATLSEFGCQVVAAASGLEAIERLQGQEFVPHLVISDYRLAEGETGLDAIRMVIENQRALFGDDFVIPSLVLSGDTAPSELQKVQQAGLPMLHKPVRFEELYDAVNVQLEVLASAGTECANR